MQTTRPGPHSSKICGVEMRTLVELWPIARQYGRVSLHTMEHGCWCKIEFNTIQGIELKANTHTRYKTPNEALIEAITKAEQIVAQFTTPEPRKLLS